jgi:hypothetical protein
MGALTTARVSHQTTTGLAKLVITGEVGDLKLYIPPVDLVERLTEGQQTGIMRFTVTLPLDVMPTLLAQARAIPLRRKRAGKMTAGERAAALAKGGE